MHVKMKVVPTSPLSLLGHGVSELHIVSVVLAVTVIAMGRIFKMDYPCFEQQRNVQETKTMCHSINQCCLQLKL